MAKNVKEMLAEANGQVQRIDGETARRKMDAGALVVDLREPAEVSESGKVKGAVNVPRGMLEFRADAETPYHNAEFSKDRPVLVYCASGGRAALAGKTLQDMGYSEVYNMGGFKEWADAGGEVERT